MKTYASFSPLPQNIRREKPNPENRLTESDCTLELVTYSDESSEDGITRAVGWVVEMTDGFLYIHTRSKLFRGNRRVSEQQALNPDRIIKRQLLVTSDKPEEEKESR